MMNCPLHPLRAEAIAEENEIAALRAENQRLLALIREWSEKRERSGAPVMTYDVPLIAAAKEKK